MIHDSALYYPQISFNSPDWAKCACMYYENVYRVAPHGVICHDSAELAPLVESGALGKPIDPGKYAKSASKRFMSMVDGSIAAALTPGSEDAEDMARLHEGKIDAQVRSLFLKLGYKTDGQWLSVPVTHASNYMLYLATVIGRKNSLDLITDMWAPWTATTFSTKGNAIDEWLSPEVNPLDEDTAPLALFSLVLSGVCPLNLPDIPSAKIVEFREKRRDERARLRVAIREVSDAIRHIDEPAVRNDLLQRCLRDYKSAHEDYRKSADIINVQSLGGFSMASIVAPATLASFFSIDTATTVILSGTSLALGAICTYANRKSELSKLRRENVASCLIDIQRSFQGYTSQRGGGDVNFHAYNCLEEYVND